MKNIGCILRDYIVSLWQHSWETDFLILFNQNKNIIIFTKVLNVNSWGTRAAATLTHVIWSPNKYIQYVKRANTLNNGKERKRFMITKIKISILQKCTLITNSISRDNSMYFVIENKQFTCVVCFAHINYASYSQTPCYSL